MRPDDRSFDLQHLADDHGAFSGKLYHAYSTAGVLADRLAEDFHQRVGESIDRLRLLAEPVVNG
jgi:hypothetical protein